MASKPAKAKPTAAKPKTAKPKTAKPKAAKPKAAKPSTIGEPDPRFAPVVAAFARDRTVTGGLMMASFGLKVNGKIFAMVVRGQLVTKLPRARVDELVAAGQGSHFDPGHGRPMKEWLALSAPDVDWLALSREAHRFVGGAT